MKKQTIKITTEYIKLDQLLKFANICSGGGEAKMLVGTGEVCVNGEACTMRGKKIRTGDYIEYGGNRIDVE